MKARDDFEDVRRSAPSFKPKKIVVPQDNEEEVAQDVVNDFVVVDFKNADEDAYGPGSQPNYLDQSDVMSSQSRDTEKMASSRRKFGQ